MIWSCGDGRTESIRFGWYFSLLLCLAGASAVADEIGLVDAAEKRDFASVRNLLAKDADVNGSQVDGMTALHWAVYHDDAEVAALMLQAGADVNVKNRYGVPPLSLACTNANAPLVEMLLEAGADPNAELRGGETALMTAARTGCTASVNALIRAGADPDARERHAQTAIMWAAAEGHAEVVEALIEAGADFQTSLDSGFTPLLFAVREGRSDVVQTLMKAGVDVNAAASPKKRDAQSLRRGQSPLLLAIENGHFELAASLLEEGADPNDARSGFTPLHLLSGVRKPDRGDEGNPAPEGSGNVSSLEIVRILAKFGADVNARLERDSSEGVLSANRATPFLLAAKRADVPLMRVLVELGADPLLGNENNSTPLMAAAGLGTLAPDEEAGTEPEAVEAVRMLLDLGVDINAVDSNGETAMHGAAYKSLPRVVNLLAARGADIDVWNKPNKYGWTPLSIAEGYRPGNFKPSFETIEALQRVMESEGVPLTAPHVVPKTEYN